MPAARRLTVLPGYGGHAPVDYDLIIPAQVGAPWGGTQVSLYIGPI
jgi:hypothetical protein